MNFSIGFECMEDYWFILGEVLTSGSFIIYILKRL